MLIRPMVTAGLALCLTLGGAAAEDYHFRAGGGFTYTERSEPALGLWLSYHRGQLTEYQPSLIHLGTSRDELAQGATERASFLRWHPTLDFRTGTDDVMGAWLFDLHADLELMPWSYPAGAGPSGAPDLARSRHTFPFSLGVEADRNFNSLGIVGQLGWRPVAGAGVGDYRVGVNPILEFGVQGGYKVGLRTPPPAGARGGDIDESLEPQESFIARLVGTVDGQFILRRGNRPITWDYRFEGYWDMVNSDLYHRLSTELRVPFAALSSNEVLFSWDVFRYENGSGRPSFNEGQQMTTGLSAEF